MGPVFDATVGDDGGGLRELQHGEAVVALANAQRNGFTRKPLLLLGPFVGVAFPFGAGQDAAHFAAQVDAGGLAKTQRFHEVVDQVHAHFVGQRVVVNVARHLDRTPHVQHAQVAFGAAKTVARKVEETGVVDHHVGTPFAGLQRSQRHEGFVGGARWVGATQRAVQQRFVDGFTQRTPAFLVDAFHKQVGVERGFAHKRQHFAGARVDGHQCAPAVAKHVLDQLLQLDVDRQHDGLPRCGRAAGQAAHGMASGGGFHLLHAGGAVELALEALLHPKFADVVGAAVVGLVVGVLDPFFLALVDTTDVPNHMAGQLTLRVGAKQPRLDLDPRKPVTLRRKPRNLFFRHAGAQGQRLKIARLVHEFLEPPPVAWCDVHHLGQRINRLLDRPGLGRCHFQCVGRVVGGQHHTLAVQNQPPVRHDRHDGRAVVLGLVTQVTMPHHLQVHQPRRNQPKRQQHHRRNHKHPPPKPRQVCLDVA